MKISKENSTSSFWVYFLIIWGSEIKNLFPETFSLVLGIFISITALLYALLSWKNKFRLLDFTIFTFALLVPLICSLQANQVFNQPIWMGFASLRSLLFILLVYVLKNKVNQYDLIKKICDFTVFIMIIDSILLLVFDVDNTRLSSLIASEEFVDTKQSVENSLRGKRLTFGCSFQLLAMAWWSYSSYVLKNKNAQKKMLFSLFFTMLISKGRIQLVLIAILWILPYILELDKKNFRRIILYGLGGLMILLALPSVRQSFSVVADLFGSSSSANEGDFSGVARLNEILLTLPFIQEHPLFGSGNVSYHYNDGFEGCLGEYFFVSDIGIVGMMFIGGIFLCISYFSLFFICNRYNYHYKCKFHLFIKLCCIIYSISPFMGLVPMIGSTIQIMIILLIGCFSSQYNCKDKLKLIK